MDGPARMQWHRCQGNECTKRGLPGFLWYAGGRAGCPVLWQHSKDHNGKEMERNAGCSCERHRSCQCCQGNVAVLMPQSVLGTCRLALAAGQRLVWQHHHI
ncbi:hypothetical protein AAFF_G00184190 [Aldrovandia affinis]|uniref:Uncharacterized protein n=1 Tax=Aldrovandia affinis TaxID=143900 RepID=A0AAD7RK63_9TELE|nr:hypothetical protein AAFF_G00184190 [Aldrovandia affinis]